ncbi:MAG: YncE family protein [Myxococcota bacterium]
MQARGLVAMGILGWVAGCGAGAGFGGGSPSGNNSNGSTSSGGSTHVAKVYVANEAQGSISVLDEHTGTVLTVIDLTDNGVAFTPHNVQGAPDGRSVWVTAPPRAEPDQHGHTAEMDEQAIIIDPTTDTVVGRVNLGRELHVAHVIIDSASRHAYVTANEANQVLQVDVGTRQVVRRFELGADRQPHGMRECGGLLYVANITGKSISIVDPAGGTVDEVPLGGMAVQTACTPDGRYVFVSLYDTLEVVRLHTTTRAVTRIALPAGSQGPIQLYPTPDSTRLYVCDQGLLLDRPASNRLYEVNVEEATVAATIEVGSGAHGVVVSDDGTKAYVTNIHDNSVSVVDTQSRSVVRTIPVGEEPNGVSHWHGTGAMP